MATLVHRRRRSRYADDLSITPKSGAHLGDLLTPTAGLVLVGGGALLYYFRDQILEAAISVAGQAGWFPDPSSRAAPYAQMINQASAATGVEPALIAAIGDRESGWGLFLKPKGPGGTGDNGNGLGLMQLDIRYNAIPNWQDPASNILAGAMIYASFRTQLAGLGVDAATLNQAAADAYNCGVAPVLALYQQDPTTIDQCSTGTNYGSDVMARAAKYGG